MTDPIHQATTLIQCGQWETAAGILYGVLAETPDNTTALALMAVCKWQLGQHDTAAGVACQLTRTAPRNPTGHYLLAQICLHRGDIDAALHAIHQCLHTNPNGIDALKLCITIQRRSHCWSDARATRRYLEHMHPRQAGADTVARRIRRWLRARHTISQPCLMVYCQAA